MTNKNYFFKKYYSQYKKLYLKIIWQNIDRNYIICFLFRFKKFKTLILRKSFIIKIIDFNSSSPNLGENGSEY